MTDEKNRVTLYTLIALGHTPGSICFFGIANWADLWDDPYKLLFESQMNDGVPGWWNLYCIGYDVILESGDRKGLSKNGHINMDANTFEGEYGYSYNGGRDLLSVGKVAGYKRMRLGKTMK